MSQLNKTRGEGSSADWKPKLRREIASVDFLVLLSVTVVNLRIRFPQIWIDDLNNYEIKNIGIATVILSSWIFVLWFNGSRDTNILGFGADEYKRLINAALFSFTFIAFISYIFKLEISRGFVLLIYPSGLISLFIFRRILRKRLLKSRNKGRYVSRVLLLHSGEADPVEKRLLLAKHAGLNIVQKLQTKESEEFNHKQIVASALTNNCDQIMVGQSAIISASELRNLGWAL